MLKQLENRSIPWFGIGITSIFVISAALRFWGLGRFNTLVFDEVYYAKFANNYLTRTPFFNAHPPLSQYIIAIGIWLGSHLPFGNDNVNGLAGSLRSTFSYRWLNALTGSFIPLVVAGVAYQLSQRRSYAFIAALFVAADGLFLVESRYALNNIYLVILGLLGQWCFLLALSHQGRKRWIWLGIAGFFFGASACIKWNGLWFLLGAYMVWAAAWVMRWARLGFKSQESEDPTFSLQNLTQLNFLHILLNLGFIPILVYSLLWIPHLQMNPKPGFWDMQNEILHYHERIGDGPKVHPYCSKWYTWPLMLRPIAYFYETARNTSETAPALPPLPAGAVKVIYDVHAMGNPVLYLLSAAAILLLLLLLAKRFLKRSGWKSPPTPSTWIALYLVLNYAANLLPWVKVTRCTFLYHYMGASVFAALALAWIVDHWLHSVKPRLRAAGVTVIFLILLAFVFWMPVYLGLPLSADGYKIRMLRIYISGLPPWLQQWLPNWI
ncbi:MAG: phospholipid carrier-dependent glycosyltransferase [Aphanothece sp. CMT-3BRIN-NPC111]|jgi:dolichyl-phosphate-mannose--protein O-mannosyl transferase|nr:phospholipid carrier-dependent glycosyltransferase [Aphanothece sp. CMT-3BRIN-NPC111]